MLKDWSDDYLTGIDQIDVQHKRFFAAAHALYDSIVDCEGENAVEDAVAFLREYAEKHFRTEEVFMQKQQFPHIDQHRELHGAFFDGLDGLAEDLNVFGPSQHLADRALGIAQDWLIDHIIEEDARYVTHVKNRRI